MHHLDLRQHLEQLAGEMARGAHACRGVGHRAWLRAQQADQFRDGLGGN
jgi:hypothetical protein